MGGINPRNHHHGEPVKSFDDVFTIIYNYTQKHGKNLNVTEIYELASQIAATIPKPPESGRKPWPIIEREPCPSCGDTCPPGKCYNRPA